MSTPVEHDESLVEGGSHRPQGRGPRVPASYSGVATTPIAAVVTHDNLDGLRHTVASLLEQTRSLGFELMVVECGAPEETRNWVAERRDRFNVISLPSNVGPAAGRNAVISARPNSKSYFFFDDDTFLDGTELRTLESALESDLRIGLVSEIPATEEGVPLAASFLRRPFERAFPRLWQRWWGWLPGLPGASKMRADVAPGSAIGVRGSACRAVGGFDLEFWPAGFEDLDLCAKLQFRGDTVIVDRGLLARQKVSVTTRKVFGRHYTLLRRSSGVLFAAVDYPLMLALGRLVQALAHSVVVRDADHRSGDANGLLRCAREWRYVLRARELRRRWRKAREAGPAEGSSPGG